jgi:hypothetical protein
MYKAGALAVCVLARAPTSSAVDHNLPLPLSIMPSRLQITIDAKPHYEFPEGLTSVHATATRAGDGELAFVSAIRIDRAALEDELHAALEAEHHELAEFAVAVLGFDGRVRPWLITPGYRAGSGVWGPELNEGRMLFIYDVQVDEKVGAYTRHTSIAVSLFPRTQFRGQGIGTQALQHLLASSHLDAHDFAYASPSPSCRVGQTPEDWARLLTRQVNFFRQVCPSCIMRICTLTLV